MALLLVLVDLNNLKKSNMAGRKRLEYTTVALK
jgi:hypothetical protein